MTRVSLKESRAGLVVVGVRGEGVGEAAGERTGLVLFDFVGVALAVLFWPAQPVATMSTASTAVGSRNRKLERIASGGACSEQAETNRLALLNEESRQYLAVGGKSYVLHILVRLG